MERALFKILTVLMAVNLGFAAVADDIKYPEPRYGGFGAYGYKLDGSWKFPPMFKQAKPFNDGLAAVSFDGEKYALINQFGVMVTDFIFDTAPTKFQDGIAQVTDADGLCHFINLKGEKISPDFKYANRQGPLIIASPDNVNYNIYDYNFEPINETPFKSVTVSIVAVDGERASSPIAETLDGTPVVLDWRGHPVMGDRYTMTKQMWYYTKENKGIKKAFDKGVFNGGENILVAVKSAANGQFGIASLAGTEVVPCTYPTEKKLEDAMKKLVKDKLLPYLRRNAKNDVAAFGSAMVESREQLRKSNLSSAGNQLQNTEIVRSYCSIVEKAGKRQAKGKRKANKVYYLSDNFEPKGDAFKSLEQMGYYFVGTKQNEKVQRLYNIYGMPIGDAYDAIKMWGYDSDDVAMFMVKRDGKWGLMSCMGDQLLPIEYDHIDLTSGDSKVVAARRGGKEYALNGQTGRLLTTMAYDEVSSYCDKDGLYSVKRLGYETKIDEKGNERPSIPELVFNQVESLPLDAYDQRIEGYKKCIGLCGDSDRNVLGLCWNNMGVMFMKKGDTASGRACYEAGASYGNQTAISNLSGMKQQERQQKINAIGDFLNTMSQAFGGAAGTNAYVGGDYSEGGSYSDSSSSSPSGNGNDLGLSTYQSMYQRWERNAKSNYESLTRAGVRVKKNGNDVSGSSGGSWRPQNYTGLKQNLRRAQSEMRKIRQEARRYGHNIPQSNYETVTVSY